MPPRAPAFALLVAALGAGLASTPSRARAQDFGFELELGAIGGVDEDSIRALGWGLSASPTLHFRPHPALSIVAGGQASLLFGEPPAPWAGTRAGLRLHWGTFFGADFDPWVELSHTYGVSGEIARHGGQLGVGVHFPWFDAVWVGPFARVTWISDPDGTDVWLLSFGVGIVGRPTVDARPPRSWRSRARRRVPPPPEHLADVPTPRPSDAIRLVPDVELLATRAIDPAHVDELDFGVRAMASLELRLVPWLGLRAAADGGVVAAQRGAAASMFGSRLGVRFHFTPLFDAEGDLFVDLSHAYVVSSAISSHGAELGVGYGADVTAFLRIGPSLRVSVFADPAGEPLVALSGGVMFAIVPDPIPIAGNRDADRTLDRDDHCPEAPEGWRGDRDNEGCPVLDLDADGIPDDRDWCNREPMGDDPDPDRPGCPLPDRDRDGTVDAIDFCPDHAVERGRDDPLRDGCPLP